MTAPHPPPLAPGRLEAVRQFINTLNVESGTDRLGSPADLLAWLAGADLLADQPSTDRHGTVHRQPTADRHGTLHRQPSTDGQPTANRGHLGRAIALREALRDMLRANHSGGAADPAAIQTVNEAARQLSVAYMADGWTVAPTRSGVDGALGRLLAIVVRAGGDGTWQRLKICVNDACQWAFYDHSRSRSGRWCTMGVCGNRAKQQAWRDRKAAAVRPARRRRG